MEKVLHSEWAAPVVVVLTGDGKIRLCGDFKVTMNKSLEVNQHLLPKSDELFAALSGVKFSKIDLTQAYQQMVLDKDSRVYVTINTHLGLFRYTCLPFGIASERNYSQLKKEAWSLIFTVHTFHQYLHEREFTLYTDHKPLTTILGPKKGTPPIAAARLQRWALQLATHNYTIQFRPTKAHANSEALSRLPLKGTESKEAKADLFSVRQIEALPVTLVQRKCAISCDPILSKVLRYTKYGWPDRVDETLKPYWNRRAELTLEDDCIM